jgi:hypothetical protein
MEETQNLSDTEYLYKLRIAYLQAVHMEDYSRISTVIVPEFLERFGKYYEEYGKTWKSLPLSHFPIQVVIDPRQQRQKELDWAEHVLKGQIELIL